MLLLVEEETFILEIKIKGVGPRELLDQLLPLSVPFRQTIYGRGTAIVNPLGRPGWLFFFVSDVPVVITHPTTVSCLDLTTIV